MSTDYTPESLKDVSNKEIMKIKGLDMYSRFYLVCMKYGKNVLPDADIKGGKLVYKGGALNLLNRSFFTVEAVSVLKGEKDILKVEGIYRKRFLDTEFPLFALDGAGNRYEPEITPYPKKDVSWTDGSMIAEAAAYTFLFPLSEKWKFYVSFGGQEILLDPSFHECTGLTRDFGYSCVSADGYILSYEDRTLSAGPESEECLAGSNERFLESIAEAEADEDLKKKWRNALKIRGMVKEADLKDRAAFISTRSSEKLMGNMEHVYDKVKSDKVSFFRFRMQEDQDAVLKCAEIMYTSRVIVTDDYLFLLRNFGKAKGQKVVQLWHATGALKGFGQKGTAFHPSVDARYHKDYDLVTVSSEYEREMFAEAFNIGVDKVQATGIARTDELFDQKNREEIPGRIYERYGILKDKEVIVYAPTFREISGKGKSEFDPELDFRKLSESLNDDQIFVICPHPVMTEPVLKEKLDNVIEIRDISTAEMMYIADLLITDYSSVAIEFSAFNKPMLFYCYDFDRYERGVFMDYERELPGKVIKKQDELIDSISCRKYQVTEKTEEFRMKYLGACDGRSSERIASMIDAMVTEH